MPKISIGTNDTMYLMKPSTHAARGPDAEVHLLISAHGAVLPGSFTIPAGLDLHFYGKHSAAIRDRRREVRKLTIRFKPTST
jgi:hypothetical protein